MADYISRYGVFAMNALKEKYTYRFKALMWSLSTLFNMLIQYYLWKSVYHEINGDFMGVSQKDYLIYISFGVVFYNITSCAENMYIAQDIKSGNIAMNLCKPIDYKAMVFFRHVGTKVGELIGLIPLIIVAFFLTMGVSFDIFRIVLFGISTLFAFILMFNFFYLVGIFTFWTTNYWGVQFFTNAVMGLFSGQLVAIGFFREIGKGAAGGNCGWVYLQQPMVIRFFEMLGNIAYCLPFQSMYYTPMGIFSGIIKEPIDIARHIFLQLFWLIIIHLIIQFMWNRAQRKITIFGG